MHKGIKRRVAAPRWLLLWRRHRSVLVGISRIRMFTLAPLLIGIAALAGCTNSSIASARAEIAGGNYAAAHHDLVAAETDSKLSAHERREVKDDLCLTEYKIAAPSYPLSEQRRVCTSAAVEPDSQAVSILAAIEKAELNAASVEATRAIAEDDLAHADDAIRHYQSLPGADPKAVASWSRQLWTIIGREDRGAAKLRGRDVGSAISQVARQYPRVKGMSKKIFQQWVENSTTISGTRMVSGVQIESRTLNLWIANDQLQTATLNLDRFARINDGLVARCHCDGRTNIALEGSGLPAFLVRLDPEIHQSEILILARP
jgi:hypothetical protein